MNDLLDLDAIQKIVNYQAVTKGWKTEGDYCLKRAYQELDEVKKAIENGESKEKIALEIIDVFYFLVQIGNDKAEGVSLTKSFLHKLEDNWNTKKKTEDKDGNVIRK